jgi:hypothetical protein
MQSDRHQKGGFTAAYRTIIARSARAGACASRFDNIGKDFRLPTIPNGEGRRQTQPAGLKGTKIPCLQSPYNLQHSPFGNPPVAEESAVRFRQLKIIYAYLEKAGPGMTTSSHFCGTLPSGVLSDSDSRRHLHG